MTAPHVVAVFTVLNTLLLLGNLAVVALGLKLYSEILKAEDQRRRKP